MHQNSHHRMLYLMIFEVTMMVTFVSQCEKKALGRTRRLLGVD